MLQHAFQSAQAGEHGTGLKYERNPKHGREQQGNISPEPTDGQKTLDGSLPVKTGVRVGIDKDAGEIVVFREHLENTFHGYVSGWADLSQEIKNVLIDAGLVTRRGKIVP